MDKLRVGNPLDKCIDVGAMVPPSAFGAGHGNGSRPARRVRVHRVAMPDDTKNGCFYPPTLITGLQPADTLMQEEIFGPVLCATTFRTPMEAVDIANATRYGLAASVWSENINTTLDIAPRLVAGVVWINGSNMFDAAAGFGGVRESGFGAGRGLAGAFGLLPPSWWTARLARARHAVFGTGGAAAGCDRPHGEALYRWQHARPDGGYAQTVYGPKGTALGQVSIAGRKDVRNAVEAQQAARAWHHSTGHLRAQILYYLAENLNARAAEFAGRLDAMTGGGRGR